MNKLFLLIFYTVTYIRNNCPIHYFVLWPSKSFYKILKSELKFIQQRERERGGEFKNIRYW